MSETREARPLSHGALFERFLAVPFLLYGMVLLFFGMTMYLFGVVLVVPRVLFGLERLLLPVDEAIVWYSGVPVLLGLALMLVDLLLLFGVKRIVGPVRRDEIDVSGVTVALTAYNDEASIGPSVRDFLLHPKVRRVIVVSNNSTDETLARAEAAGAVAVNEPLQGYGRCVFRAWREALLRDSADLIMLCEGDQTFRAYDIDKLLAYAPHADREWHTHGRASACLRNAAQHLHVLWQPVRGKTAGGKTPWQDHDHGCRHHV